MTKNKITVWSLLFGLGLWLTSCVAEDYTGCWVQPLRLSFSYDTLAEGAVGADEVHSAHIYFFDEKGVYVASWVLRDPDLSKTYDFELETLPGKYEFVVWFNQQDPYYTLPTYENFTAGQTRKQEAQLGLSLPSDKFVRTTIPHLLHGKLAGAVITGSGEHHFTIPVSQYSNTVKLTVKGLPANTETYGFSITDNNGVYDYDCSHVSCETFQYTTTCASRPVRSMTNELEAFLNILRLGYDRSPKLRVFSETTGREIYPAATGQPDDLVDLIRKHYPAGIDFDLRHYYEITLEYDTDLNITVDIDVWGETKDDYEIDGTE